MLTKSPREPQIAELNKILIIGHSNIGDVCYDLAVVSALHRKFPQAKIAFLTSQRAKNIAEGYPGIDSLIDYDRAYRDRGAMGRLRMMRRLAAERFDLAVALKKTWMHHLLGIRRRWSVDAFRDDSADQAHCVDTYLAFLRSKGVDAGEAVFDFRFSREDEQLADALINEQGLQGVPCIAMLSTAAWSLKSWPVEMWNRLAEALQSRHGIRLVNVAYKGNTDLDRYVDQHISRDIVYAGQTTLKQALALITRCRLFIGPDSSFLHLASCLGVPTIGLYGPTPVGRFYPYFHRDNILKTQNPPECMPCYPHFKQYPCGDEKRMLGVCMQALTVEDVLKKIEQCLNLGASTHGGNTR